MLVVAVVALLATAATTLSLILSNDSSVERGTSLEDPAGVTWPLEPLPPGQEFVLMFMPLLNRSDSNLRISSISPVTTEKVPEVADIVSVSLAQMHEGEFPSLPQSVYLTYPPALELNGDCEVASVKPASGFVLSPSEDPSDRVILVLHMRARSAGEATFDAFRVEYTQGGDEYQEVLPLAVRVPVETDAKPSRLLPDEKPCRHLVKVLPGARAQ